MTAVAIVLQRRSTVVQRRIRNEWYGVGRQVSCINMSCGHSGQIKCDYSHDVGDVQQRSITIWSLTSLHRLNCKGPSTLRCVVL